MVKTLEGKPQGSGRRVAIVVSKFNDFITKNLLNGCLKELSRAGVKKTDIRVCWVPGAYEIPVVALKLARKKSVDAVICLGAVIRGETYHYELVAQATSSGIKQAAMLTGKPVIFGVLATETLEQAYKRSEENGDNKGSDAAFAALEMIDLLAHI